MGSGTGVGVGPNAGCKIHSNNPALLTSSNTSAGDSPNTGRPTGSISAPVATSGVWFCREVTRRLSFSLAHPSGNEHRNPVVALGRRGKRPFRAVRNLL